MPKMYKILLNVLKILIKKNKISNNILVIGQHININLHLLKKYYIWISIQIKKIPKESKLKKDKIFNKSSIILFKKIVYLFIHLEFNPSIKPELRRLIQ